jgi:putative flippase GtrA
MLATSIAAILTTIWMYLCFSLVWDTFKWSSSHFLFALPSIAIVSAVVAGYVFASVTELK